MFTELQSILGGFYNFILCLAIGMVLLAGITLLGFSLSGLNHPLLGWYALFLNRKKTRTVTVVLLFVRLFFVASLTWTAATLSLTHVFTYVLMTVLLWLFLFRVAFVLYDVFYSGGIISIAYLLYLLSLEVQKIQPRDGMKVLLAAMTVFLLIAAMGQFFTALNFFAPKEINQTENDVRLKRWSLCLIPCLYLVILLPYYVVGHIDSIVLNRNVYQFAAGEKTEFLAGSELTKSENGCVITLNDNGSLLAETPIYDKENGRAIFTAVCSIVRPNLQMTNRINPLSILEWKENKMQVVDGERTVEVDEFFLFDGRDTYYFNAGTVLAWEEEQITLSAFSQVEVLYNQRISVFDYEKAQYSVYETGDCFCIATMSGNEQVNLSTDILYRQNGQEQMLFLQPALLSDLE